MTLKEFEMHRPRLAADLIRFVQDADPEAQVESVVPKYEDRLLFSALITQGTDDRIGRIAVCVSPSHPMAFGSGAPVWRWEDNLLSGL